MECAGRSIYETAADPTRHRVADLQLAQCNLHGSASVLCSFAGKIGRQSHTAALGATLFWLTCPFIKNIISRLEGIGAVRGLQTLIHASEIVAKYHIDSHAIYEARVKEILDASRWEFFKTHFTSAAVEAKGKRKYGNAAVSHAKDLKCLHALISQSLCGAPNIIGDAIMHYILFLSEKVDNFKKKSTNTINDTDNKVENNNMSNDEIENLKKSLDSVSELVTFVENWAINYETNKENSSVIVDANSLCSAACNVLTFLEGHPPRMRKKHRIN